MRTRSPQRHTAGAHIANFRLDALRVRAVGTHYAGLALQRVERAHERGILLHGFGDGVPKGGVQRLIGGPFRRGTVNGAGGVLELEHGPMGDQLVEVVDVRIESVGVVDLKGAGVDFVHAEAAVEVGQGCDAGANPAGNEGRVGILLGGLYYGQYYGVTEKERRNEQTLLA